MQKTVKIHFEDGFEFPERFDSQKCCGCIFCNLDARDIDNDCCMASEDNICPFHGNKDNIEL